MNEQIKRVIAESNLAQEEKDEFSQIISKANTEQLQAIENILSENPEFVATLYKNYKDKLSALAEKDTHQWKKILDKEKDLMLSSSKN